MIPGLGQFPGEENGNPLQYSCLENPRQRSLCGLQFIGLQSQTQLSVSPQATKVLQAMWSAKGKKKKNCTIDPPNPVAYHFFSHIKNKSGDFHGDLVTKTLCSQCRGPKLNSWPGNQIPHAATKSLRATSKDLASHNEDGRSCLPPRRPGSSK